MSDADDLGDAQPGRGRPLAHEPAAPRHPTAPSPRPVAAPVTVVVALADSRLASDAATVISEAPALAVVGEATRGDDLEQVVAEAVPDVVVLDPQLAAPDAATLVAAIARTHPVIRVLVVHRQDDEATWRCLAAGAAGAVPVDGLLPGLLAALRRVARGETVVPTGAAERLQDALARAADTGGGVVPSPTLTPTETEVLRRLAGGATPEAIAQLHEVTVRAVNLSTAAALLKYQRWARDTEELERLR